MLRRLGSAGYTIDAAVINASHLGVPQARRRLIVVGTLADGGAGGWLTSLAVRPTVSVGVALAGLHADPEPGEAPSGKWADLLREVPPGDNYLHFTAMRGYPEPKFEWRSRYWNFLLKLHPDRPAPTIQAQPGPSTGPFHWENRRLRVPELKRLFAYPDDYVFVGSRASVQRQIGDSVPPPVGRAIGLALRSSASHDVSLAAAELSTGAADPTTG
jgi:DNA (cytosine-5)-methyltransferase 1